MAAIRFFICALAFAFCAAASAATPYVPLEQRLSAEQLRETGLDTLSAEQLAALNRVLQGEVVATQPPPKAAMPLLGVDVQPIQSRLKGTVTGWQEGAVFELENGQQWKVLKGHMTLPKPMQSPEIRVVPGIAGRWFLEVHEDYPKARVYLIN
ncbi:hypothetical protein [Chromobacterium sp.]|uniref:hypothetical protein n=1 Tax=Chromobacterium sp. TaxID=306190 RepID=UPI0035AF0DA2